MFKSFDDQYNLLNKKYTKEQNDLLTNRLKNIKAQIKTNCPNTFIKNTRKQKTKEKKDLSKKIDFNK